MLDFSNAERTSAPYPLLTASLPFARGDFEALLSEFPGTKTLSAAQNVMGGRRRLASDEQIYYKFLESSPAWRQLHEYLNSTQFVVQVLALFKQEIEEMGAGALLERLHVNSTYFEGRAKLKSILPSKLVGLFYRVMDSFCRTEEVFVHVDISAAGDGYEREVHRDTDQRVAVLLIHFVDAEELGGTGGEFGVHSYRRKPSSPDLFERQPPTHSVKTELLIPPRANEASIFLSTPDSYHSVPKIRGSRRLRKFIYVGISKRDRKKWYR